ncbi:hypothetical protein C4569_02220 [Candidatus Parcubacteria bacterium]|nr:MAG: hypothetical protein C4569_02220 [Candidatus Parcubacteria bacterium]
MRLLSILMVLAILGLGSYIFWVRGKSGSDGVQNLIAIKSSSVETIAKANCIQLCQSKKQEISEEEFSKGPCLSGSIVNDWVCDVAHNPRQNNDDEQQNQCAEFRQGKAHHFIEVTPDCQFIKAF